MLPSLCLAQKADLIFISFTSFFLFTFRALQPFLTFSAAPLPGTESRWRLHPRDQENLACDRCPVKTGRRSGRANDDFQEYFLLRAFDSSGNQNSQFALSSYAPSVCPTQESSPSDQSTDPTSPRSNLCSKAAPGQLRPRAPGHGAISLGPHSTIPRVELLGSALPSMYLRKTPAHPWLGTTDWGSVPGPQPPAV